MSTRIAGRVRAYSLVKGVGHVTVEVGNKTLRLPTDEDWRVGEAVIISVGRLEGLPSIKSPMDVINSKGGHYSA